MFPEPFVFTDIDEDSIKPVVGFALDKDYENPFFLPETVIVILSHMCQDFASCSWGFDEVRNSFWFVDLESSEQNFYEFLPEEVELSEGIMVTMYGVFFVDFEWKAYGIEEEEESED